MKNNLLGDTLREDQVEAPFTLSQLDSNLNNVPSLVDHTYVHSHYSGSMVGISSLPRMNFFNTPEQLQFILQNLDNGIVVQSSSGIFLYCNPSASLLLGFENPSEMMQHLRSTAHILHDGYIYKDNAGNTIQAGQWPWEKISPDNSQYDLVVNLFTIDDKFIRRLHIHSYLTNTQEKRDELMISTVTDVTQTALLEKQKDEFMSLASHELKTPITSMKVFTQTLLRTFENKHDPQPMYYLSKIEGQLNKLTLLVKEMLEVSRLQTGRLQLHQEHFPIHMLIQEICEQMQFTTNDHRIQCSGDTQAEIYADKERIGQVLVNLIGNAIKFSPANTTIFVSWEIKNNTFIIDVKDEGIGISQERQVHIFDRFAKNDDATESTFPGMGVGLYIASEIVKRHNGTIKVTSEKEKGSLFTIALPIKHK